jgi:hypothetical protein
MSEARQLGDAIRNSAKRLGLAQGTPFDLGVLLVHGIGEQKRGDTLTEAGDEIVEWLRRRVEASAGPAGGAFEVLEVVARQASEDGLAAAHAVVRITPPGGDAPRIWVIGEAWWADVFRGATYGQLAGWGISIGPWVLAMQARGIAQRLEQGAGAPAWLRLPVLSIVALVGIAMLLIGAVGSLGITVLALGLVALAFTRIPLVADAARSLQQTLANGFGDAYILTRSPIRFAAMSTQVRSDLQALRQQCAAVMVVAHSQGTAVAWHALKRELTDDASPLPGQGSPAPVKLLITYGQAIRKLTFLLRMARGHAGSRGRIAAACAAGFILAAALLGLRGGGALNLIPVAVLLAVVAEAELLRSAQAVWRESGEDLQRQWLTVRSRDPSLAWLDLWASADPFPGGPLGVEAEGITSLKIRNLGSSILDHVVYWQNSTEFLVVLASRFFTLGGPSQYAAPLSATDPGDAAPARIQVSAMRRHARVMVLLAMRMLVLAGSIACAVQAWLTPRFSAGLMTFLKNLRLPLVEGFFDEPPDWTRSGAGVLLVLLAAVVTWLMLTIAWHALDRRDERTYLDAVRAPLWSSGWFALAGFTVLLAVAIGVSLVILGNPALAAAYAVAATLLSLLAMTVFSGGGQTLGETELQLPPMESMAGVTGTAATGATAVAVLAAVLIAIPVAIALAWTPYVFAALAIEGLALGAVLAIEGIREYRLFAAAFTARNAMIGGG